MLADRVEDDVVRLTVLSEVFLGILNNIAGKTLGHNQPRRNKKRKWKVELKPDQELFELIRKQEVIGGVAVERRRVVEEGESDVVTFTVVPLDRVGVFQLVDRTDDAQDEEELDDVEERLAQEMVEVHRPRPEGSPVLGEDPGRPDRGSR